jgi:hypothetical protein
MLTCRMNGGLGMVLVSACLLNAPTPTPAADTPITHANQLVELTFIAQKNRSDPFHQLDLDVIFTTPDSKTIRVPAFWAGGKTWRVRYASPTVGIHHYLTLCTDKGDKGLDGRKGQIEVRSYHGANPLYRHGPIRVAADHRHFAYADGTPFFWLGDTWWMGLCDRLHWPTEFKILTADRRKKGFNVIQIVAGLYPDMPAFDPRGRNEAGFPWEKGYRSIRPDYFDKADRRIEFLADQGLVPCIVMAWGYHLPWLGMDNMKRHVRYVIARYGALPVVWCVAGEVNLPYYLNKGFPYGGGQQAQNWGKLIKYARSIYGFHRLITVHPTGLPPLSGRLLYKDQTLLDFDMLQTGHGLTEVLAPTVRTLHASYAARPTMPVVNSEVSYEALSGRIPASISRMMFWVDMLSGAAGHTYGANGIWQLNRRGQPYGKSPHGGTYGPIPWDEAMHLPGSTQIGLGKQFLEKYAWQRFQPHPDWASWATTAATDKKNPFLTPYSAGDRAVHVVYIPTGRSITLHQLETGKRFDVRYFDPVTGRETPVGVIHANAKGSWTCSPPGGAKNDWILVVSARKSDQS